MNSERIPTPPLSELELLSRRLDDAVKSWETLISDATRPSPRHGATESPRPLERVLRDFDVELETLRRRTRRLTDNATHEAVAADHWAQRAMLAVQEGRDDLARSALRHHQVRADAAERLRAEIQQTECMCEALEEMIDKLRSSTGRS